MSRSSGARSRSQQQKACVWPVCGWSAFD